MQFHGNECLPEKLSAIGVKYIAHANVSLMVRHIEITKGDKPYKTVNLAGVELTLTGSATNSGHKLGRIFVEITGQTPEPGMYLAKGTLGPVEGRLTLKLSDFVRES